MKKQISIFALCFVVLLAGCTVPEQKTAKPSTAGTDPVPMETPLSADDSALSEMDQAFGEMVRTDGAVLADMEYNGAGKLAAYYREFKGQDNDVPSCEGWTREYLPEDMVAEKPEEVAAIILLDLTASAYGFTTRKEEVGTPVKQRTELAISFYHPQSWRRVLAGTVDGRDVPVGSYVINWSMLAPPEAGEVQTFIRDTMEKYRAIPVSENWQAFDRAFGAFVADHFSGPELKSTWDTDVRYEKPDVTHNGSHKKAGCFYDFESRRFFWTDAILPDEAKAGSPEDVSAIVVAVRFGDNTSVNHISISGDSTGRNLELLHDKDYPDFSSLLDAIKGCIPYIMKPEGPGPYIALAEYGEINSEKLNLVLENVSSFEYDLYCLCCRGKVLMERCENGVWEQVPSLPPGDMPFHFFKTVPVGGRIDFYLYWADEFGVLEPGKYRASLTLTGQKQLSKQASIWFEETLEIEFVVD